MDFTFIGSGSLEERMNTLPSLGSIFHWKIRMKMCGASKLCNFRASKMATDCRRCDVKRWRSAIERRTAVRRRRRSPLSHALTR